MIYQVTDPKWCYPVRTVEVTAPDQQSARRAALAAMYGCNIDLVDQQMVEKDLAALHVVEIDGCYRLNNEEIEVMTNIILDRLARHHILLPNIVRTEHCQDKPGSYDLVGEAMARYDSLKMVSVLNKINPISAGINRAMAKSLIEASLIETPRN